MALLTDADNFPAGVAQPPFGVDIATAIPVNHGAPECGVGTRLRAVFGATVPEAAIDEHEDYCYSEDDVSTAEHVQADTSAL